MKACKAVGGSCIWRNARPPLTKLGGHLFSAGKDQDLHMELSHIICTHRERAEGPSQKLMVSVWGLSCSKEGCLCNFPKRLCATCSFCPPWVPSRGQFHCNQAFLSLRHLCWHHQAAETLLPYKKKENCVQGGSTPPSSPPQPNHPCIATTTLGNTQD